MRLTLHGCVATSGLLVALATTGSASDRHEGRAFLAATFGLTANDFTKIDAGEVLAKGTAAGDARDIATFGIVRARITPAFYVERLADIVSFKKDDAVVQIGVFGRPPALRDVESLDLDESDIRSLRECRIGHCGLQLPAETITRFRAEVDWARADARQRANGLIHQMLVDYVKKYQQSGASATMQYADRDDVINVRNEFLSLASSDAGGLGRFGILRRHFVEYPSALNARRTRSRLLVQGDRGTADGGKRDAPGDRPLRRQLRPRRSPSARNRSTEPTISTRRSDSPSWSTIRRRRRPQPTWPT